MASYIKINAPGNQTYFYTGSTPQSAYAAYQQQVGKGGSYAPISQSAFNQGLASFGKSAAASAPAPAKKAGPSLSQQRTTAASKYKADLAAYQKKQAQELQNKLNALSSFVSGQEKIPDLRSRLSGELGIPQLQNQLEPLRQQALGLENTLLDLPEYVAEITRGQGEARRKLLETSKGEDLTRQIRNNAVAQEFFAGQLAGAQQSLSQSVQDYKDQFERELFPLTTELDVIADRQSRELTGYTSALQNELDAILRNVDDAFQLQRDAANRAHELAMQERSFANARATAGGLAAQVKNQAISKLTSDVKNAATKFAGQSSIFPQLVGIYSDALDYNEIKSIYDRFSPWGPSKESFADVTDYLKGSTSTNSPTGEPQGG